jgi:hypothetical protein
MSRRIAHGAKHVPALRGWPVFELLAAAEILLLARRHVTQLDPQERRRFVELVRLARGRRSNLTPEQRAELAALIQKTEPRVFVGEAANRLSPFPLPRRFVRGRPRSR